jgi:hypothetical protein
MLCIYCIIRLSDNSGAPSVDTGSYRPCISLKVCISWRQQVLMLRLFTTCCQVVVAGSDLGDAVNQFPELAKIVSGYQEHQSKLQLPADIQ